MILSDILCNSQRKYPNHPALIMRVGFRTLTLTYNQVYELAQQTAAFLADHGVGKGDCVAVCAPNSPYWICLFWGCVLRGAVIVPLNIQSTDDMIAKIIKQTDAKLFFALGKKNALNLSLLDELVAPYTGQKPEPVQIKPDDLVQILYTSGTTGEPKGVMLTHRNLAANVQSVNQIFSFQQKDRLLSILPLSHIFEQTIGFLAPYSYGATIIYAHNHAAIQSLLQEFGITLMLVVPEFLKVLMARIMDKVHESGKEKIITRLMHFSLKIPWFGVRRLLFRPILKELGGCLSLVASGGAPLDPELEQHWNAFGVHVIQGYGLTETSPLITGNMPEQRVASVGKAIPGVNVRLASDGEIQAKGDNVFQGYFKNEEKTRQVFTPDGWFMTGDMGEFDADGFLFIRGRKKYMIKGAGAQNVYPEDIEEALNREPAIKDSCVLGIEHPGGAVQIHAVLLLHAPLPAHDVEALINNVNAQLASYQHIGGWTVWQDEDFPRSATRKVKKEDVRARLVLNGAHETSGHAPTTVSKLVSLIAQITGASVRTITPKTLLTRQLHMDSLMTVELLARIEQTLSVAVDGWIIGPTTTVEQLQSWIDAGTPATKPVVLKSWPRSWWGRALRALGQPLIVGFARLFVKIKVEGIENLDGTMALGRGGPFPLGEPPKRGSDVSTPVIFMPTHLSQIDPIFLAAALPPKIRRRISFASAKDVLYEKYRFAAPLSELLFYSFPFPRKETENITQGLTLMGQMLECGYSVVVFPEGKISLDGKLQPLKQGAGLIATQMMATIIPVALIGVQEIIGPDGLFPKKRGTVTVRFGKPITMSRSTPIVQATAEIEAAMQETIEFQN